MDEPELGLFFDVSYEVYEAWEGLRHSNLRAMVDRTPAHYRWKCDHPDETDSDAKRLGRATHTAILEPDKFADQYIRQPETYEHGGGTTKPWHNGAKFCKEWNREQGAAGKVILSAKDFAEAVALAKAVRANDAAAFILDGARTEVSLRWNDIDTGLLLKGRLDVWKPAGVLADIKTTRCAAPGLFGRDAYRLGYLGQMALYYDGARAASGLDVAPPILIAVEKVPPWLVCCYQIQDEMDLELGRAQYRISLRRVKECQEQGKWPGYKDGLCSLVLPGWAGTELEG